MGRCAALAPAVVGARLSARVCVVKSKRILNHHHGEADNGLSLRGSHFLLLTVKLLRAVEAVISGMVLLG